FEARLVEQATAPWEFWYGLLEAFVDREGHARIPVDHVENGFPLGRWGNKQRAAYANSTLAADPTRRLERVPRWPWDGGADQWEDAFAYLEAFVAREGHARIPIRHIENGFRLGRWVNKQRAAYADSTLAADRVGRLEVVPGWSWEVHTDRWEEAFAYLE